jgi:hypothetical protein
MSFIRPGRRGKKLPQNVAYVHTTTVLRLHMLDLIGAQAGTKSKHIRIRALELAVCFPT